MTLQHVNILFQLIVFLFAISFHESAHAWMANLRGDPTARMLGRITLNPIKHIDPLGTIVLPAIALYYHIPVLGWAKPTPVDPRNFKNHVLDDILTAVAGPVSNFLAASLALFALGIIKHVSPLGQQIIFGIPQGLVSLEMNSALVPLCLLLYQFMVINVVLGVFNLIPVPPLDGSHVLRHFLPAPALRIYDTVGMFGLMALVFLGGNFLFSLISPFLYFFTFLLFKI
ncbi:MAG: site-2 protease family protein [Acidobacteriia bacterium]|nr:site-2 protease family protein [Terriglobia bacterium]